MYSLFIDDSGSLHPKHISNHLIISGFLIPTRDLKRCRNIVKKTLAKLKKQELKSAIDIDLYFPKIIDKINLIWPRPQSSDCSFLYLKKKDIFQNSREYSLKIENEIRAKAISLLSNKFVKRCNTCLDVIYDEFFGKESKIILSALNSKYKFSEKIKYDFQDSIKEKGIQIAHCTANSFLRFKENKINLLPYLNSSLKQHRYDIELKSKELKTFSKNL